MLRGVRGTLVALVLLARIALPAAAADVVPQQTVTPVTPGNEQRIEQLAPAGEQRVETLTAEQLQQVSGAEKGPIRRGVETAGKVVLGVVALGVSLGFTVASLLLF